MKHLKFIFVFLIIVSQTLYSQSSMTIYPTKDAYTEAKNGKANYNGQNIKLGYQSPPNYNQFYPVFFFQMPNNINSSQVDSAKLYLTKIEGSGTQTEVVGLYITANWEENSITSNWLNSNVSYTGFDKVNNVTGDLVFPMTIAVKKWLDNPSTNFGFALYPEAFSPTTVFIYYDKENGIGGQKPRLVIWYKEHKPTKNIQIIEPNKNTVWTQSNQYLIRWTANYSLQRVNLYYKAVTDPVFIPLNDNPILNNYSFKWSTPEMYKEQVIVKVEDADDPNIYAISDVFLLKPPSSEFRPNPDGFNFANTRENMWPSNDSFPTYAMFLNTFGLENNPENFERYRNFRMNWRGSCYGFSLASLLRYCDYITPILGYQRTYDVPLNQQSRDLVNKYFLYQWDRDVGRLRNTLLTPNFDPRSCIKMLKDMFKLDRQHNQPLALYYIVNDSILGGHSVVPYRVSSVHNTFDTIFVYDPNLPGNSNAYILVDSTNNIWRYPSTVSNFNEDWVGAWGLFPDLVVSTFRNRGPNFFLLPKEYIVFGNDYTLSNDTFKVDIFFSGELILSVYNKNNEVISNFDINPIKKNVNAYPIIPLTGGRTKVVGFYLDQVGYDFVNLSYKFLDGKTVNFGCFTPNLSISLSSTGETNGIASFKLDYQKDSLIQFSQTNINNYDLLIMHKDQLSIKQINFYNSFLRKGDSLSIRLLNNAKQIVLTNKGSDKTYRISFKLNKNSFYYHNSIIEFKRNQTHIFIIEDWNNLQDNSKKLILKKIDGRNIVETDLRSGKTTNVEDATNFKSDFNISYNAANNSLDIFYSTPNPLLADIIIFNLLGNKVLSQSKILFKESTNNKYEVDVSNLCSGAYFCILITPNSSITYNFFILK